MKINFLTGNHQNIAIYSIHLRMIIIVINLYLKLDILLLISRILSYIPSKDICFVKAIFRMAQLARQLFFKFLFRCEYTST